jgi:hypothetical protein
MRGSWMMVMEVNGKLMPQAFVGTDRAFKKAFLHIAWQVGPDPECGVSNGICEGISGCAHLVSKISCSGARHFLV